MGWILAGTGGRGRWTCDHGFDKTTHPDGFGVGAWDCPECNRLRAEEKAAAAAIAAAANAATDAATAELAANPPTEEEKQAEAAGFIDRSDPEWPTPENMRELLPLRGLAAEEFLKICRP